MSQMYVSPAGECIITDMLEKKAKRQYSILKMRMEKKVLANNN